MKGSHELESLASDYFEEHVAANQDNSSAIDKITVQFQSDLIANRNRMRSEAALRIQEADLHNSSTEYFAVSEQRPKAK